jgi:hypothetical protein
LARRKVAVQEPKKQRVARKSSAVAKKRQPAQDAKPAEESVLYPLAGALGGRKLRDEEVSNLRMAVRLLFSLMRDRVSTDVTFRLRGGAFTGEVSFTNFRHAIGVAASSVNGRDAALVDELVAEAMDGGV